MELYKYYVPCILYVDNFTIIYAGYNSYAYATFGSFHHTDNKFAKVGIKLNKIANLIATGYWLPQPILK